jgi:hypothetical protein
MELVFVVRIVGEPIMVVEVEIVLGVVIVIAVKQV